MVDRCESHVKINILLVHDLTNLAELWVIPKGSEKGRTVPKHAGEEQPDHVSPAVESHGGELAPGSGAPLSTRAAD